MDRRSGAFWWALSSDAPRVEEHHPGAAGYRIRAHESKISRLELGRVGFKDRDIADLLEFYGVEDAAQRDALVALAREANAPLVAQL